MSAAWCAYLDWKVAAGPLADFVLPTPFLAERTAAVSPDAGRAPRHPLARRLASGLLRREARGREAAAAGRTIVFLEAVPRLALATAVHLRRHGWPIAPVFGRWPIAEAVLSSGALVTWLCGALAERPHPNPQGPALCAPPPSARAFTGPEGEGTVGALCVLLDAERRRAVPSSALRRRFDNRYEYGSQMLPPPARLRAWGVTQALWAGPAAALAPDLQHYADTLVNAGLPVELVRQADLTDASTLSAPAALLAATSDRA